MLFHDVNVSGVREATAGEPSLAGRTVYVDLNSNGSLDTPAEPTQVTGEDGTYSFSNLPAGQVRISQVVPSGWKQTGPMGPPNVLVTSGDRILEYTRSGELVRNILVPKAGTDAGAWGLRDVTVDQAGKIYVLQGSYLKRYISVFDPQLGAWQHHTDAGLAGNYASDTGELTIGGNYLYIFLRRFDLRDWSVTEIPYASGLRGLSDLRLGGNGKLYGWNAGSPQNELYEFDSTSFALLRTLSLLDSNGTRIHMTGAAISAQGDIFAVDINGQIRRYNSQGLLQATSQFFDNGYPDDVDLSPAGYLVGGQRLGKVSVITTDFALRTTFQVSDSSTFAAFANYQGAGPSPISYFVQLDATESRTGLDFGSALLASTNPVTAIADVSTIGEDALLSRSAPGVLANDTAGVGVVLTATIEQNALHGSATVAANGSFTYQPAANYNGLDSFSYRASDGKGSSQVATVFVTVTAVNDPPTAGNDAYYLTQFNTNFRLDLLSNDLILPDSGETLRIVSVGASTAGGSIIIATDGSHALYTPPAGFIGVDTFTYTISDRATGGLQAQGTVTLTVTEAPRASVAGTAWDDRNGNGIRDAGEPGVGGMTITLDSGVDGTIEATTLTDASGKYSFFNLDPGTYAVGQVLGAAWQQTFPNYPLGGQNFPIGDFEPVYAQGGAIRTVPGQYASIQAAMNAAVDGDTVQVSPGVYKENVDFLGKAVVLTSLAGPDLTIIDGNQAGTVVDGIGKEGSRLHGFTIRNGRASDNGGGIDVRGSGIISSNRIVDNQTCGSGGGIYATGSPTIQGNEISRNNQRSNCSGGGGSAIYAILGSARIVNNLISDNKAPGDAIIVGNGSPLIKNNIVQGNSGSGIELSNDVRGTIIVQNLIIGNTQPGINTGSSRPEVIANNTIANNGGHESTAIWGLTPNYTKVFNNIFAAGPGSPAVSCDAFPPDSNGEFKNNLVFTTTLDTRFCNPTGANGNIAADPLFVDAAIGDFRLRADSPAIDRGLNTAAALPTIDLDGQQRVRDGNGDGVAVVDIGADEFGGSLAHVVSLASGEAKTGLDFRNQAANRVPTISSNGGGDTAKVRVVENAIAVADVEATDSGSGPPLVFRVSSGADASKFAINAASGELTFAVPPDYDRPADGDQDNVYDVVVEVTKGTATDYQTLAVTVTNINEPPTLTSGGGGASASYTVAERTTVIADLDAIDPENATVSYLRIGGPDLVRFSLNSSTGLLSFTNAPDYENPTDSDKDNTYSVIVQASDGNSRSTQTISVTVTNTNDGPTIYSLGNGGAGLNINVPENVPVVTDIDASAEPGKSLTYSISGVDADRFAIDAITGLLTLLTAPDFENPTDAGSNRVYNLVVSASDGTLADSRTITVTVTAVNEPPAAVNDSYEVAADGTLAISPPGLLGNDSDPENDALLVVSIGGGVAWDELANGDLPSAESLPVLKLLPGINEIRGTTGDNPAGGMDFDSFVIEVPPGSELTSVTVTDSRQAGMISSLNWRFFFGAKGQGNTGFVVPYQNLPLFQTYLPLGPGQYRLEQNTFYKVAGNEVFALANYSFRFTVTGASNVGQPVFLPSGAVVAAQANGSFLYDPRGSFQSLGPNQTATDSFTYTAGDGQGNVGTATVTVTVHGSNDAPQAVDDFVEIGKEETLGVAAELGLLANDVDADGNDTKTVAAINGLAANVGTELVLASGAKLLVRADGSYQYEPNGKFASLLAGQSATETFTYVVADEAGETSLGTVTIRVLGSSIQVTVITEDGGHRTPDFVRQLFVGLPPGGESNLIFETSVDAPRLFAEQPHIDSAGTLTFKPAPNSRGTAILTVVKKDVVATSPPEEGAFQTEKFVIELVQQAPWQNDVDPNDVNNDGDVVAEDVLLVINFINAVGSGAITNTSVPGRFYDTNGDNSVLANDVLKIINLINAGGNIQEGEAESILGAASVDKLWGEANLDWYWSDLNQDKITGKQRRT